MSFATALLPDGGRSDKALLCLISEGSERAFAAFYDRTASRVLGLVRRILVDPAQSEEVTQEVFLAAWQEAARFDPDKGTAVAWLLTRAHRRAIDMVQASQANRDRDRAVGIHDLETSRDDVAEKAEIPRSVRTMAG